MGYREVCIVLALCIVATYAKKHHHHDKNHLQLVRKIYPQKGCSGGDVPVCCNAKNNTCRVFGPRLNNDNATTCFCDSACGQLGDCCHDYHDTCSPVDCMTDPWAPYGACSTRCGWGIKKREKRVLVQAAHGGKACGQTEEKLACYGYNCRPGRAHAGGLDELRETGKIIPAKFGSWRKNQLYNPFKGIRKNLFDRYSANEVIERPTYCARYEVTASRKSCNSTFFADWAPKLHKGATVCVECQSLAMKLKLGIRCRGHGVFNKQTRWNAATVPGCHGEWVMKSRHEECQCDIKNEASFILI